MKAIIDKNKKHLGGNHDSDGTYYPKLFDYFINTYKVKSAIDIGCGRGRSSRYFALRGVKITAVDGLEINVNHLSDLPIERVTHDFTLGPLDLNNKMYDFGWCCEVLEHIDEEFTDNILLAFKNCKRIGITHALPGQRGHHHVNCRESQYWVNALERHSLALNLKETEITRGLAHSFYARTGMIFDNLNYHLHNGIAEIQSSA